MNLGTRHPSRMVSQHLPSAAVKMLVDAAATGNRASIDRAIEAVKWNHPMFFQKGVSHHLPDKAVRMLTIAAGITHPRNRLAAVRNATESVKKMYPKFFKKEQ